MSHSYIYPHGLLLCRYVADSRMCWFVVPRTLHTFTVGLYGFTGYCYRSAGLLRLHTTHVCSRLHVMLPLRLRAALRLPVVLCPLCCWFGYDSHATHTFVTVPRFAAPFPVVHVTLASCPHTRLIPRLHTVTLPDLSPHTYVYTLGSLRFLLRLLRYRLRLRSHVVTVPDSCCVLGSPSLRFVVDG